MLVIGSSWIARSQEAPESGPIGAIVGRVLSCVDERPVIGGIVEAIPVDATLSGRKRFSSITDVSGGFRIYGIPAGDYDLRIHSQFGPSPLLERDQVREFQPWGEEVGARTYRISVSPPDIARAPNLISLPLWKGTWRNLTVVDGLANVSSWALMEDSLGRIWVGGGNLDTGSLGACYFDGETFVSIGPDEGLACERIYQMAETADGLIWMATSRGLFRGKGATFQRVESTGLGVQTVIEGVVATADSRLWVSTQNSVFLRESEEFIEVRAFEGLEGIQIHEMTAGRGSGVWVATNRGAFKIRSDATVDVIGLEEGLPSLDVNAVHEAANGDLWIGTARGVVRIEESGAQPYESGWAPKWEALAIDSDKEGSVWVLGEREVYLHRDETWTRIPHSENIADIQCRSLMAASDGSVWISTYLGGVFVYSQGGILGYGSADGLRGSLYGSSAFVGEETVLVGSDLGVEAIGPGKFARLLTPPKGFDIRLVSAIEPLSDGRYLLATGGVKESGSGILIGGTGEWTYCNESNGRLAGDRVHDLEVDQAAGRFWAATHEGLSCLSLEGSPIPEDPYFRSFNDWIASQGIVDIGFLDIYRDGDGALWLSSWRHGIFRLDGATVANYGEAQGLPDTQIHSLSPDGSGSLWACTRRGLYEFDGSHFTLRDDAPLLWYVESLLDSRGILWFGSWGGGLVGFDGETWTVLDHRDGLTDDRVIDIEESPDGSLILGGMSGVTIYRPNATRPRVEIVETRVGSRVAAGAQSREFNVRERLSLELRAVDFKTRPEKRRFLARALDMSGNGEWAGSFTSSGWEWTPEAPGRYRIEVQAVDRDLNRSDIQSMDVVVRLPWTRRATVIWPSLGGVFCLVFWSAYISLRYRSRRRETLRLRAETHEYRARLLEEEKARNEALSVARDEAERANRSKTVFLANMSHEIRTPLNAVLGYTEALLADPTLNSFQKNAIQTISSSGRHLLGLINDILDVSKIEAEQTKLREDVFDLKGTLEEIGRMFEFKLRKKGIHWKAEWDLEPGGSYVIGDESRVRQILINLISNAEKFTTNGEIRLRMGRSVVDRRLEEIAEAILDEGEPMSRDNGTSIVWFAVEDSGTGIKAEDHGAVFEPFRQVSDSDNLGGTGLGLSIVRKQVQLMNGAVALSSELGRGSTFVVVLPLRSANESKPKVFGGEIRRLGEPLRCLVIDDVFENRETLRMMLTNLGAEVATVETGTQGVNAAFEGRFDVVFVDIHMPDISGLEVARRLRADGRTQARLIAVSASTFEHERRQCLDAGFDEFLGKPILVEQLVELLESGVGVVFETIPAVNAPERAWGPADAGSVEPGLLKELYTAASLYQTTEFREKLDELRMQGGGDLAAELERMANQFDMESAGTIIAKVIGETND